MKLTNLQVQALETISKNQSGAQFHAITPSSRRSLFKRGLIEKNWNHPNAMGNVEYLRLTQAGREVASEVLCWGR